jgi:methionine biosynthesis protein MetW
MALRPDLAAIADLTPQDARVLDVGCGDGALLEYLSTAKNVDGHGLELSQQRVNACVARGLPVIQGDADTDLEQYPSQVFDVVILSLTIQATRNPKAVLSQMLRIGRRTIVSLPNFGNWRVRFELLATGHMPRTKALDNEWYDTPNIHLCTIADFVDLAGTCDADIETALALTPAGRTRPMSPRSWVPNLMAEGAIFLLRAGNHQGSGI